MSQCPSCGSDIDESKALKVKKGYEGRLEAIKAKIAMAESKISNPAETFKANLKTIKDFVKSMPMK